MIKSGAFAIDITPQRSVQLAGYPFVERKSTGVHDPLLASALYMNDGKTAVLFISCDLIYIGKETALCIRQQIERCYGIPKANIMITATHTHSGPATVSFIAGAQDALQEPVDTAYLSFLEAQLFKAAQQAIAAAQPSEVAVTNANVRGIGTNRHHPNAASDPDAPLLLVRRKEDQHIIACMLVCSMHPTVLHEDSILFSGDFPGMARRILQQHPFSPDMVFLFQLGTAGNQSPRHVTQGNTFEEAERLAGILAQAIVAATGKARYQETIGIKTTQGHQNLVRKQFPAPADAAAYVTFCRNHLEAAIAAKQSPQEIRSKEVNWFGAKEMAHLSQLAASAQLEEVYRKTELAEILIFKIGPLTLIGWPGEIFVEYGLEIKNNYPGSAVITLVNGELQGYIVTPEAETEGVYEASNAIFDPSSGTLLVAKTKALLEPFSYVVPGY